MEQLHEYYNSLGLMLRDIAFSHADKAAVIFQGGTTSYAALEKLSNQVANALRAGGIREGDHVGLYCINSPWFVAAWFGIAKCGAGVIPINLLLNPQEVSYILQDSEAAGLVYFEALEPGIAAVAEAVQGMKLLICAGTPSRLEARPLSDVMAKEPPSFEIPAIDTRSHVASIIYTSGTTGRPKGAVLTHRNLLFNVNSVARTLPVRSDDLFLSVLPMFHAFGCTACMLTPIAKGATIIAVPRFTPEEVGSTIASLKATVFMGVPSMYALFANMREERKPDLSSLRFCISGGAALPIEVMQRFEAKFGIEILEGDGPTECSPVTAVNPPFGVRKPGSIGLPIGGVEMRIVDDLGQDVAAGTTGEIVVRGENVMKGYFKRPEETREAFFGEWYRTGDMGYVDEDGYFYIVDRKKDLIIVNGMNVYPRMVEEVIYRHAAVAEVAVVPQPHRLHGEVPRALIVLRPGMTADKEEILRLCRQNLGRHEIPRMVEFVNELPKTPTGKILKRALIRRGEIERGIDIE